MSSSRWPRQNKINNNFEGLLTHNALSGHLCFVSFEGFFFGGGLFGLSFLSGFSVTLLSLSWNSFCRPDWPGTHRNPSATHSGLLGLRVNATTTQLVNLF